MSRLPNRRIAARSAVVPRVDPNDTVLGDPASGSWPGVLTVGVGDDVAVAMPVSVPGTGEVSCSATPEVKPWRNRSGRARQAATRLAASSRSSPVQRAVVVGLQTGKAAPERLDVVAMWWPSDRRR